MNILLDIKHSLKEQFERQFRLNEIDGEYYLHPSVGAGQGMKFLAFPGQMEFYHFQSAQFSAPVSMKSVNPPDSDWFLLHINLSRVKQRKRVDGEVIDFHKHLPIGILLYGPGLEIDT